jgi:hypothetical protein
MDYGPRQPLNFSTQIILVNGTYPQAEKIFDNQIREVFNLLLAIQDATQKGDLRVDAGCSLKER